MVTIRYGHLRGPVILTPVAVRLAVELSLSYLTTRICPDRLTRSPACEANALRRLVQLMHDIGKVYQYTTHCIKVASGFTVCLKTHSEKFTATSKGFKILFPKISLIRLHGNFTVSQRHLC